MAGAKLRPTRRRRLTILEADVFDSSGKVKAVWFNRAWLADRLQPGTRLLLRGKLEKRGFNVAEHEFLDAAPPSPQDCTPPGSSRCTRPASACGRSASGSGSGRRTPLARHAVEPIPGRLRRELRMAGATDSIVASALPGRRARRRGRPRAARLRGALPLPGGPRLLAAAAGVSGSKGIGLPPAGADVAAWLESLPFSLTGDQQRAVEEIDSDLGLAAADAAPADG